MDYISVKSASEKWRYQKDGYKNHVRKIVFRVLRSLVIMMIPKDPEKPMDGRIKITNKLEDAHGI
jgi:hypothetical protein